MIPFLGSNSLIYHAHKVSDQLELFWSSKRVKISHFFIILPTFQDMCCAPTSLEIFTFWIGYRGQTRRKRIDMGSRLQGISNEPSWSLFRHREGLQNTVVRRPIFPVPVLCSWHEIHFKKYNTMLLWLKI